MPWRPAILLRREAQQQSGPLALVLSPRERDILARLVRYGLTAAPAIANYVRGILAHNGLELAPRKEFQHENKINILYPPLGSLDPANQ